MVKLKRETGVLTAKQQGNPGFGKITPHADWVRAQVNAKSDITLDELVSLIAQEKQLIVHRSSIGQLLARLGLTQKKDLQALEQKRADVARRRHLWVTHRQPFMAHMLDRIAFVDETWLKTNMAKTTGWAPRGRRLVDHAPFGH